MNNKEPSREEILEIARQKSKEWVESPDFASDCKNSQESVQRTIDHIHEVINIDMEEIMKPFDI